MIKVHKEPEDLPFASVAERCCFCRANTKFWVTLEDMRKSVACCESCAKHADPKDVPSKKEWFRRERIATALR